MKKRLQIIISNYDDIHNPYYSGGGAHAMHEIGKRLAKRHDVTLVVGKYPGYKNTVIDNVRYQHVGRSFVGPLLGQITFALSLPFVMKKHSFDVWFENFVPPHSTNMLPFFTKKPVIGITSLLDAKKFTEKYHITFHIIENKGLGLYKYFIALSEAMKQRIRRNNTTGEIRVIPDGISTELLKLSTREEPYIYFLGRIDIFQKGLDVLLDAWKIVVQKNPGITLVIAGDGTPHDRNQLIQKVTKLNLKNNVKFTGRINGKKKNMLMQHALAAVFPSRFESFGIAPLEAMAVGKPMICFDIEGFRWIDPSACIKITKFAAEPLAEGLMNVVSQKKLRATLSRKARIFARPYTWDEIAVSYEKYAIDVVSKTL